MQPADPQSSPADSSFAGLLAALTAQKSEAPVPASPASKSHAAWADELEDDVTTISYESALRTHARYKRAEPVDWNPPRSLDSDQKLNAKEDTPPTKAAAAQPARAMKKTKRKIGAAVDKTRKRTSVTIRLSEAEYAQLHIRSAEAGLTVSAYLRSCTFEAEALRSQVKQALAQLRTGAMSGNAAVKDAGRSSWRERLARMLSRLHLRQRAARL